MKVSFSTMTMTINIMYLLVSTLTLFLVGMLPIVSAAKGDPQRLQEALSAGLKEIIDNGTWQAIQVSFFGSSPAFPPGGCTDDGNTYNFPPKGQIKDYLDAGNISFGYKLSPPRVFVNETTEEVTGNIAEIAKAVVAEIGAHYNEPNLIATFKPTSNAFGYFEDFLATLADIGPKVGVDVALGPLSITVPRSASVYYTCSFTTINFSFVRSSLDPSTIITAKEDFAGLTVSVIDGSTEETALQDLSDTLMTNITIVPKATAELVLEAASGPNPTVYAALLNTPAALKFVQDNSGSCMCSDLGFELLDTADADRIGFATDRYECAL